MNLPVLSVHSFQTQSHLVLSVLSLASVAGGAPQAAFAPRRRSSGERVHMGNG